MDAHGPYIGWLRYPWFVARKPNGELQDSVCEPQTEGSSKIISCHAEALEASDMRAGRHFVQPLSESNVILRHEESIC